MRKAPIRKKDDFDRLAEGDTKDVLALVLWKARHHFPDLAMTIDAKDMAGYRQCLDYLKATPEVRIVRPLGRPAQDPVPAAGNRRAVPGYPAEPPRPFVVVALVEKGTENAIRVCENNEGDNELRILAERTKRAREGAQDIAGRIEAMTRQGADISNSDLLAAAEALRLLAR